MMQSKVHFDLQIALRLKSLITYRLESLYSHYFGGYYYYFFTNLYGYEVIQKSIDFIFIICTVEYLQIFKTYLYFNEVRLSLAQKPREVII